jgi:site-specific DNA-methyltransferase (adenine-specific)
MGAVIWQKVTTCHTRGAVIMGLSFPSPQRHRKIDYEFILIFKSWDAPRFQEIKNNPV